ncbi:MAG: 50S ribosomal protein L21e [Nanoarchaeota archaeon]|mgnify:CR=1 FL=1
MASKRKPVHQRGKIRLSEYFKELNNGDKVAIKKEKSIPSNFNKRVHGRTGEVVAKRGSNYVVKLKEFNKEKTFIVHPIHLKKIKLSEKVK